MSLVTPSLIGIPTTLISAVESWTPGEPSRFEEVEVKALVHIDPLFDKADVLWTSDAASSMEVAGGDVLNRGWGVSFLHGFFFTDFTYHNYNIKAVRSTSE
jgi:hypothetical protein